MPSSIDVVGFPQVFSSEISSINDMRGGRFALGRRVDPPITLHQEGTYSTGEIILAPNEEANLVGLSLSGGGIRSAAFCLGVLQALNRTDVLHRIDYMSTVSGGGYVGISLSASLEMTRGEFPFETDFPDENPVLQHLRNYSNYLFPHGAQDLLVNFAIYARGLVTNFLLIMPFLLVPAALTILWNPTSTDLRNNSVAGFPKTLFLAGLFICLALLWAVGRQMKWEWLWLSIRQWGGSKNT
jgi:hypothetical protein